MRQGATESRWTTTPAWAFYESPSSFSAVSCLALWPWPPRISPCDNSSWSFADPSNGPTCDDAIVSSGHGSRAGGESGISGESLSEQHAASLRRSLHRHASGLLLRRGVITSRASLHRIGMRGLRPGVANRPEFDYRLSRDHAGAPGPPHRYAVAVEEIASGLRAATEFQVMRE